MSDKPRSQHIVDLLPQMVWANEPEGDVEYYNDKWREFTGLELGDGGSRLDLVHPDDRARAKQAWEEAQQNGTYEVEYRLHHHSGGYRWIVSRGNPRRNDAGEIVGWYGTCTDIHERRAARDALRRSEAAKDRAVRRYQEIAVKMREVTDRLELAVQAHCIGIFDTDPRTGKIRWNEEMERIYGYSSGGFEGTVDAWRRHVVPEDLVGIEDAFATAILNNTPELSYSYRIIRKDGQVRYIEASSREFYDAADKPVRRVGVNIDVTERRAVERRLSESQAELIHLSRVTAMGAMASTLAHELNQPLTAIVNYARASERMITRDVKIAELRKPLIEIGKNAARAGEVIRRLRDMTRKGEITKEPFTPDNVIKEAGALASVGACAGLKLHYTFRDGLPVMGDPIQIQQVLINLIRNACEAVASCGEPDVRVVCQITGDETLISVEDNGPGISADTLPTLFDAFVTTKDDGMGVGLSISRTIIEAHGGRIWAENRPEGGARFSFTLPLAERVRADAANS